MLQSHERGGPVAGWRHAAPIDLVAGLTVALVGLPQCLAYAMMSGLPPAYGLATAAVPGLVAAMIGRSAQVVTGPTNTTGLLILSTLTPFLADNGLVAPNGLPLVASLALVCGMVRLVGALAGGAALVRFLPESVLVGFTAGAGILIGVMQLDEALGLPPLRGVGLRGEIEGLASLLRSGQAPAAPAVLVTAVMVGIVVVGQRLSRRLPAALLGVVGAGLYAWLLDLDAARGLPLVRDRARVPFGWPEAVLPSMDPFLLHDLLIPAIAISLLGTLELAVCARADGGRPDMRREILAQGWANVAGAFTGAFPASASLTRSALLRLGGAQGRLAAASAALFVVPILLFAMPFVGWIPQPTLAGILFVTAYRMVDHRALRRIWRASVETRILLAVTLSCTLVLPLEWAVLVGAGLGLAIHLANTSRPRLRLLRPEGGRLIPVTGHERPDLVVVEVSGALHYAAVEPFLTQLQDLVPRSAMTVVLDLAHAHEVRFTAVRALEWLADELAREGRELRLSGVSVELQNLLRRTGSGLSASASSPAPAADGSDINFF